VRAGCGRATADPRGGSFLIRDQEVRREEGQAARREDWSAARGAAIKKVIIQEARARVLARRFV
jgi:hypothetical protein